MDIKELHGQFMEAIAEIDVNLDSLTDSKASGKRKVTAELIEKHEGTFEDALEQTSNYIAEQSEEVQAAIVSAFNRMLSRTFGKSTDAYVSALVDSQPVQEPLISAEEAEVQSKQRSELYQKVKSIVQLAESVGEGPLEMPRQRRGSSGKRGPRNLSLFTFSINGEEVDETIGNIAKQNGYEKASELTAALRDAGFDVTNGDQFDDLTLPNGKVLSGFRDDEEEEETEED